MSFDLAKNNYSEKAEVGYQFELLTPVLQEPTGVKIKVRGAKAAKVVEAQRRRFKEIQQKQKTDKQHKRDSDVTIEQAEDFLNEDAAIRVISWSGLQDNGADVPYDFDTVVEVFRKHDWIREAVVFESDNLVNFMKQRFKRLQSTARMNSN